MILLRDETGYDPKKGFKILAEMFDSLGDTASGLDLSEIHEDGHRVANLLWKISGYYKKKSR